MTAWRSRIVFLGSALVLSSTLTAAPLGAADLDSCTPMVPVPYTITSPGVYCLTKSTALHLLTGHAIDVQSSNVVVDLGGFFLSGGANPSTQAVGVYSKGHSNVTVRNGTVIGFATGVLLVDIVPAVVAGNIVEDLRANFNRETGIFLSGRDSIVRRNLIYGTGGSTFQPLAWSGIGMQGSGMQVINNDVLETSAGSSAGYGVIVQSCSAGCVVEGNRISNINLPEVGAPVLGINVFLSNNVLVVNNRITRVHQGIVYSAAGGKYRDNLTSGVGTPFTGGTAVGLND